MATGGNEFALKNILPTGGYRWFTVDHRWKEFESRKFIRIFSPRNLVK